MQKNKYIKILLNDLIDKYERSKNYGKTEYKVSKKLTKESFPDYFGEASFLNDINEASEYLQKQELIEIVWERFREGSYIDKVVLRVDNIETAYKLVKRNMKNRLLNDVVSMLTNYLDRDDLLSIFAEDMLNKIQENKSIKKYINYEDIQTTKDVLAGINAIINLEEETLKRILSVKIYNDSKRFEKLENKINKIMLDYGSYDEGVNLLEEHNVLNNPGYIYIKGSIKFKLKKQILDLEMIGGEIGIPSKAICNFGVVASKCKRILTIENLTTFHSYIPKDELVVYLGGFHNKNRRKFLLKLIDLNIPFYHWGDIDLGGLRIINHLRKKTGIMVSPYLMDLSTIKKFEKYCIKKDTAYINQLKKLLEDVNYEEFYDVINYMVANKIVLEQEGVNI